MVIKIEETTGTSWDGLQACLWKNRRSTLDSHATSFSSTVLYALLYQYVLCWMDQLVWCWSILQTYRWLSLPNAETGNERSYVHLAKFCICIGLWGSNLLVWLLLHIIFFQYKREYTLPISNTVKYKSLNNTRALHAMVYRSWQSVVTT